MVLDTDITGYRTTGCQRGYHRDTDRIYWISHLISSVSTDTDFRQSVGFDSRRRRQQCLFAADYHAVRMILQYQRLRARA